MTESSIARPLRLAGRFLRRSWQALIVALLAVALGVAAFLSPGLVEADVVLDDGNVYAVKRDSELIGTVNSQIKQLSNASQLGEKSAEVLQNADQVLMYLPQSDSIVPFNAARNLSGSTTQLPSNSSVKLVGDRLLVVAEISGAIWAGRIDDMLALDYEQSKPQLEVGEAGTATLTTSGQVIGLDIGNSRLARVGAEGVTTTDLPFKLEPDAVVSISAVGEKAVVLDHSSSRIWVEGMSQTFPVSGASTARLMEPAPDALGGEDGVKAIYANAAGLNAVKSDGLVSLASGIDLPPVTPVQVGRCVYAAGVSGTEGTFARRCIGQDPVSERIESITSEGDQFAFHINRGVVALNDQANGTIWLVDKDMFVIHPEDWEKVVPANQDDPDNPNGEEVDIQPERSPENRPPTAKDDSLGARAGTSTVLNVLDNDSDPDGDVLTISTSTKLNGATLEPTRDGAGLQISISPDVTADQFVFDYTISDGRRGTSTATAVVKVHPADIAKGNTAPRKSDKPGGHPAIDVKSGSQITKRLLLDWRDPEGDPVMLKNAWLDQGADDLLSFTPDGNIEFIDVGTTTGQKSVNIIVSDGVAETQDEVILNVVEDPVAPVAYGDYATAKVGSPVQVEPLANDEGTRLTLTQVGPTEECPDCQLDVNLREGTFTFTAQKAGTYYVPYDVVDGVKVTGVVRIDVHGEDVAGLPVAAHDVALLPLGGSVVLDPLLNDTDPNGEVLVVQTFAAPDALQVVMERRHRMTISAKGELTKPVTFTYWISNGRNPVAGKITVVPTDTGSGTPIAVPDRIPVRAGTTASINPLANDTSPIGLDLTLGELSEHTFGERAWIDGERVRISVPAGTPGGVSNIGYTVVDSRGGIAPGTIAVEVVAEDALNTAPVPEPVIERVLAGTETRIPIPLSGIDANGDAVRLVGLASGPQLGRITSVGAEYLTYEAFVGGRGTDTFKYQVVDAHGEPGIGEVRVGVAPLSTENTKPVALPDEITVRPGRPVQVAAIRNDFDADGDAIGYADGAAIDMDDSIKAEVVENEVVLTAPADPGTYAGTYSIQDSRGEQAYGQLIVNVAEDAANIVPLVRDDSVPLSGIVDQKFVEIDPLKNDFDPDGAKEDLRIEIDEPATDDTEGPRVDASGRLLTVPVKDSLQQIRYLAVDGDGGRSSGIVVVPGTNNLVPELIDPDLELKPTAGQPFIVEINDYVRGTQGRSLELTTADHIWVTNDAEAGPDGESRIRYTADRTFAGPASLVFEVRDKVADPSDKTGRIAVISIPLDVLPAATGAGGSQNGEQEHVNLPPEYQVSNPRLEVGAGEDQRSLNLLSLFRDPDGDRDSMVIKGQLQDAGGDAQVDWSSSGEMVTASAPVTAKPGTWKELKGVVMDANDGELPFTIRVEVTASTRPTITAKADVIEKAVAGQKYDIPVTANDTSHLLKDQSVTLISARATSPGGTVTVADASSGVVSVVLDEGWHGPFTANYYVNDATADPNRQVTGTITAQVRDKPGVPSTPYATDEDVRDGQVTVQYRSTGDGGTKILGARAIASSPGRGDKVGTCAANTCTVTDLANGVPWRISVIETNEVGDSEPSPLSAPKIPDARPDPPTNLTVSYADSSLTVNWAHEKIYSSPNGGSPIVGYEVHISGGGLDRTDVLSANARSHKVSGLTNGQTYVFTVTARNQSDLLGVSPQSAPEYPSGTPTGNTSPVATPINDDQGGAFNVTFHTAGVDPKGDPVKRWIVVPTNRGGGQNASPVTVQSDGRTSYTVRVGGMGLDPTKFTIQAVNRGPDTGNVGSTGDYQIAYPQPRITEASWSPADGAAKVTIKTNLPSGTPIGYQYSRGGDWQKFDGGTIPGLSNGSSYDIRVRLQIDGLTSNEYPLNNVMPRSDTPPPPKAVSYRLRPPTRPDQMKQQARYRVDVGFETSREVTAGWDINEYRICASPGDSCASGSGRVPVEVTGGSRLTWSLGSHSGPASYTLGKQLFLPSEEGGVVSFSFPYVDDGSCSVIATGAHGGEVRETRTDSNRELFGSYKMVPIPDPPAGSPTEEPFTTVTVACTVNGAGPATWTFNN